MHTQTRVAAHSSRRLSARAAIPVAALGFVLLFFPFRQPRAAHAVGTSSVQLQPRIVNGVLTASYPTTGAVLFGNHPLNPTDVTTLCSAVLVGCQTVITAANCVCPGQTNTASACLAAGLVDPSTVTFFLQHAGFFPVASISINPSYEFGVGSDIAVLKLAAPVSGIAPSHINTTFLLGVGTAGTIVGFGISVDNAGDSGVKRVGKIVTAPCQSPIPNLTHVCWNFVLPIGPAGEDSNTCDGDAGGPLFINFGAGDLVAGLTSGGQPSCAPNSVSWDTSVYNDRAWVQTEVGTDLDSATCGTLPQVGNPGAQVSAASGELSATSTEGRSTFQVPAGTQLLRVALNGADANADGSVLNDFDLYIKAGSLPTATDYDCRDIGAAPYGFCEITAPAAGTWNVLVDWLNGSGIYQVTATTFGATAGCVGDCNGNGEVTVDELIKGVNIALGSASLDQCSSFDANGDSEVTVDELVRAVNNALTGCSGTPLPTATPTPSACPYRFNQDTPAEHSCLFSGPVSMACGPSDVLAIFATGVDVDGGRGVQASIVTPDEHVLVLFGRPLSATTASLYAWADLGNPGVDYEMSGSMTLSSDGRTLTINPTTAPFTVGNNCPLTHYNGTFAGFFVLPTPTMAPGSCAKRTIQGARRSLQPQLSESSRIAPSTAAQTLGTRIRRHRRLEHGGRLPCR